MTQPPTSGTSDPFQPAPPPPYPAGGYPPASTSTNVMAILSLVFAFVFAPLGIVFGHIAKKQIRERGEQGGGLATAGLVLGYVFTGLGLLVCIGEIALFAAVGTSGHVTVNSTP